MQSVLTVAGGLAAGAGVALFFWGKRERATAAANVGQQTTADFAVTGMTCASCVSRVERAILRMPGVVSAQVSLPAERASVRFDPTRALAADIASAVRRIGYGAEDLSSASRERVAERRRRELASDRNRLLAALVCFTPLMVGMVPGAPRLHWEAQALLAGVATFGAGYVYLARAGKALADRSADMNVLISMGTVSAFVYSLFLSLAGHAMDTFFETAAGLVALVSLGHFLEARARAKAGESMRALVSLQPKTATLLTSGDEAPVPADALKPGDVVRIRPGEQVPADGEILTGHSSIDESMLTGESIPVDKEPGERVFAGTLNGTGGLDVRVTAGPGESALARILRLVDAAQASRPPIQQLADRIAAIFVPAVLLIAIATFVVWFGFLPSWGLERAVVNAVTVLIIACPCALGLATPASIVVGVGRGAAFGVLFRDAEALEKLGAVKVIALDKTGTLTRGTPVVTGVYPAAGVSENALLSLAASAEAGSEHPLAKALVEAARSRALPLAATAGLAARPGFGISAKVGEDEVLIGTAELFAEEGVPLGPDLGKADDLAKAGSTPILVAKSGRYVGAIGVADELRPEARDAVARLHALGIACWMITGDNERIARAVAREAGIQNVRAETLPDQKAEAIAGIRAAAGGFVAMAGDGINDAPALAAADVGIAMGTGTQAAVETADVTLVSSDLRAIADAVELSRATMRNIRQNLLFAFLYNTVGIPLAAGALYPLTHTFLPPLAAAAAMAFSSVSVVSNALRLRIWRPTPHRNATGTTPRRSNEDRQ